MRKIPTVFVRDAADRRFVTPAVMTGSEWVFEDPQAIPTRKYDGTCVMLDASGRWWARREVRAGKSAPAGFAFVAADDVTGKVVGWEPIEGSGFFRFHDEALANEVHGLRPGTYELVGPRINGNPEGLTIHHLVPHEDAERLEGVPNDFDGLARYLFDFPHEGIVWHHPDGRMAKLKKRDFPRGEGRA